jgi:outer membrane protein
MTHRFTRLQMALFTALLVAAGQSTAQDGLMMGPPGATGFGGTLGLGVLSGPRYPGADSNRTRVLPVVQVRWGDGWFAGIEGVGYRFGDGKPWTGNLSVGLDRGRKESADPALRGMGDISARATLGGSASVRFLPFLTASAGLRYGSGEERDGLVADLGLRTMIPLSPSARVMLGVGGRWVNEASMKSSFGVSAAQALVSGYALYQPSAGWRDWGPSVTGMLNLGDSWQLMLRVEQRTLLGDAKKSPLVREASSTSGMAMLGWRF